MQFDINLPDTREELLKGEPNELYDIIATLFTKLEDKYGEEILYDVKDEIDDFFDFDGPTGVNRRRENDELTADEYSVAFKDTLRSSDKRRNKSIDYIDPEEALEEDEEDSPYFN